MLLRFGREAFEFEGDACCGASRRVALHCEILLKPCRGLFGMATNQEEAAAHEFSLERVKLDGGMAPATRGGATLTQVSRCCSALLTFQVADVCGSCADRRNWRRLLDRRGRSRRNKLRRRASLRPGSVFECRKGSCSKC
jgi:hypothetical protein